MSIDTLDPPTATSWRSRLAQQGPRRALVWAWALCCAGFIILGALEIEGPVWFVLFALTFGADVLLFVSTHRIADRPTSSLDERERSVRNRAYRTAYLIVFYGLTAVIGGALLLFFSGSEVASRWVSHPASHPAALTGFGVATLQLVSLLPSAIIAWTEQDEPIDFE
jgi:hypothetical protein